MTWTGRGIPCQRWRGGLSSFVEAVDDPGTMNAGAMQYEVVPIPSDAEAKRFVVEHHYSGTYPAARFRIGLRDRRSHELAGVAVFSQPASERVLARLPCERLAGVELGRLVLLDRVAGNGESWFLGQCFRHLRRAGIEALVSHSDPVPRQAADGRIIMPGHVGVVYQATNALYAGRTRRSLHAVLPDGRVFSERSMSKIRGREPGYRYCVRQLVDAGAPDLSEAETSSRAELTRWMWAAIRQVCRRVPHDGCHRYYWPIGRSRSLRRDMARLATGMPYPRAADAARAPSLAD